MEFPFGSDTCQIEVDSRDQAAITCPRCNFVKTMDAARLRASGSRLNVRCRCGHVFRCRINFRRHYRKPVRLAGEYVNMKTGKRGDMLIEDLSLAGLGFTRFGLHELRKGDAVEVRFRLSGKSPKEIAKRARVRFVKDAFVGVEFSETHLHSKDLQLFILRKNQNPLPASGAL